MPAIPTDAELLSYLDELLPSNRAAEVERELRDSSELQQRAAALLRERDDGVHSVADIWRRHRVACPNRVVLGEYLLGSLENARLKSITLHVEDVGCRYCRADLDDLTASRSDPDVSARRQRFFESSVGRTGQI